MPDMPPVPSAPKVTFGIIVLNGEPFVRYNLRALLPFAHEIIVVEGASPTAHAVATPEGHSRDATLASVRSFMAEEDPEKKVRLVTAEDAGHPDGFWPGEKDEMSRAYAERATGDWLWQVDVDEFYRPDAMRKTLDLLRDDPEITAVTFSQIGFWGSPSVRVDGWYLHRGGHNDFRRLFRWKPGYRYANHRPPTVVDETGRDLRTIRHVGAAEMARRGVYLYHYLLLFPKQVEEKSAYYAASVWAGRDGALRWAEDVYRHLRDPYHAHNVYDLPGWLERFTGEHPPQALAMWEAACEGKLGVAVRDGRDVDALLASWRYRLAAAALRWLANPVWWLTQRKLSLRYRLGVVWRKVRSVIGGGKK